MPPLAGIPTSQFTEMMKWQNMSKKLVEKSKLLEKHKESNKSKGKLTKDVEYMKAENPAKAKLNSNLKFQLILLKQDMPGKT